MQADEAADRIYQLERQVAQDATRIHALSDALATEVEVNCALLRRLESRLTDLDQRRITIGAMDEQLLAAEQKIADINALAATFHSRGITSGAIQWRIGLENIQVRCQS